MAEPSHGRGIPPATPYDQSPTTTDPILCGGTSESIEEVLTVSDDATILDHAEGTSATIEDL